MSFPISYLNSTHMHTMPQSLLLAQEALQFTEWSFPETAMQWLLLLMVAGLLVAWCVEVYRRDTHELSPLWRLLLPGLRVLALAGLLIVFLNPRTRTQTWAERPSRVAILVDVSSSMQNPSSDPAGETTEETLPTRAEQVVALLRDEDWLNALREKHEVAVFSFEKSVSRRLATLPKRKPGSVAEGTGNDPLEQLPDWVEVFQPSGAETRLGESVSQLMRDMNGRTLAGILVVTDGANNAGVDVQSTNDLARQLRVRLFALGTGGLQPPVNLEVAKVVAPSDVQLGDPFDIEAYVRGEGMTGQPLRAELLLREVGSEAAPIVVDERELTLLEDRVPVQVTFPRTPTEQGEWEYLVRVSSESSRREIREEDNERLVTINAFERPVKVLIFAGGPSWDYRFLCGTLKRHPGFQVDAYLQTGTIGISQDVDNILLEFPKDKASLYEYDVVIGFDPDWLKVSEESRRLFEQWVGEEGGGSIFVAGDIHTPLLAAARDSLSEILYLYPVFLDTILPGIDMVTASTQVRPLELTSEGLAAPLLQVTEDPVTSEQFWKEFPGFYRFYPTTGTKTGASVYALAGGVGGLGETEAPILLASQFYGQGRTFYIGSPEFYRLRAEDPDYFERFWTRLSREAAQNRLRRSNPRGSLLVDRDVIRLGDSMKIRARLLNAEFEPLIEERITIEVEQPDGRLVVPPPELRPDPTRQGGYLGEARGSMPGRYQIRLRIPGSGEILRESVITEVPDLEKQDLQQDIRQLQLLTNETGGGYLPLPQASDVLERLPDSSEQFLLGEQIKTLWDRGWLMCLITGLFGVEWLLRKLLKLA